MDEYKDPAALEAKRRDLDDAAQFYRGVIWFCSFLAICGWIASMVWAGWHR